MDNNVSPQQPNNSLAEKTDTTSTPTLIESRLPLVQPESGTLQTPKTLKRSLVTTLALTIFCISAGALIIVGSVEMYFAYQNQKQTVGSQQALIAQEAASSVKSFIQNKVGALHSAAQFNFLAGIPNTSSSSSLEQILGIEPAFGQVALISTQLKLVNQVSRTSGVQTGNINTHINMAQMLQSVKQNQDYISNVYIDKNSGEPQVIIAVPINSVYTGFAGILVASTNLKYMWSLVGNIKDGTNGLAYVVDSRGVLIAASDTSRVLKQDNLSNLTIVKQFLTSNKSLINGPINTSYGFNNAKVVTTYASLGTPDWAVITEIPTSEAYAHLIKNLLIPMIGLIIAGVIISTTASIIFARRIVQPIIKLKDTIYKFGQGESIAKVEINSNNEIGELGVAFNNMAANLQVSATEINEEHSKLKASIDSLRVGFAIANTQDNIVIHNKALSTILNLPGPVTSIQQLQEHLVGIDLKAKNMEVRAAGDPVSIDEVNVPPKILRAFIGPVTIDEAGRTHIIGTVLLVEDITEAKAMERSKDEFFSIASHELRTPLTSIRGNSGMVLEYFKDVLKDQQLKDIIEDIHTSSIRLIAIVNDFLDVSRLEQEKIKFVYQTVPLEKVIENVAHEMKAILAEKKLYLKIDNLALSNLPPVWVDENRLNQVVYNLIGNAIQYTEAGGVTIEAGLTDDKNSIKVTVTDTGRGIPLETQPLLFHKFQQADSSLLTRDTTRGTGLGLYISKIIIEAMGGTIALQESEMHKGSSFYFTLPVATVSQQAALAVSSDSTADLRDHARSPEAGHLAHLS
jgi:signal transduction histidine kinase/HAMP domain-containing protein